MVQLVLAMAGTHSCLYCQAADLALFLSNHFVGVNKMVSLLPSQ